MQKTVREIMDMITNGELHYNQSTQRKFVYAAEPAQLECGVTTKSGSLINAILEKDIQLPALYFWHNTDTGNINIHDGKQRILSIYYFINPTNTIDVTTIRNGRQTTWNGLSEEDQNKLLNYVFDIVERTGTSAEEEVSFYLINSNSMPLTSYECLSGMMYGTFLREFENYIEQMSTRFDGVKKIGRGEQAYKFLLAMFDINNSKKAMSADKSILLLQDKIRAHRNNPFIATDFDFDKILNIFNELQKIVRSIKEDRALAVSVFIVRAHYDKDRILDYYRECVRNINDIPSWDMATHKTFIEALILGNLRLDPKRFFNKADKDTLYARSPMCAYVNENGARCHENNYSKLEVDHITPWSQGGRTIIDNAQLLCKEHNTSKGNRG